MKSILFFPFSILARGWFTILIAAALLLAGSRAATATPVFYSANNFYAMYGVSGAPLTNAVTLTPYQNQISLYGASPTTRFIAGPPITILPDATGSNQFNLYPQSYRLTIAGLSGGVVINLPDTNTLQNLASYISTGAGVYTYTNNANFLVYGSPSDGLAGTLQDKVIAGTGLNVSTNQLGSSVRLQIALNSSNAYFGQFAGTGTNVSGIQASNLAASSGLLDFSLMPSNTAYVTTQMIWQVGFNNTANSTNVVMLGGSNNFINVTSYGAGVLGGRANSIGSLCFHSFILAGASNTITDYGADDFIGGGMLNTLSGTATGMGIVGGLGNSASGAYAFTGGGQTNVNNGLAGFVAGGANNSLSGAYCFVAGYKATAAYPGCYVWADWQGSNSASFSATGTNQFLIRAIGGMGINTTNPGTNALNVSGNVNATQMSLGGTDLFTLFSPSTSSNNLSSLFNTALNSSSNLLSFQIVSNAAAANSFSNSFSAYIGGTSNFAVGVSNYVVATSNLVLTVSNQLAGVTTTTSNGLQTQINVSQLRAGSITIAANATAATYSFTTPMADANYTVVLTAQDSYSAAFVPYVDSLNAGYFISHIRYATNAYDCHYYWQVKANQP